MSQLAFNWPTPANYTPEQFIISDSNRTAASFIDRWPLALEPAALLFGPAASGKTHLAHRFSARTGAVFLDDSTLGIPSEQLWASGRFAILENIETIRDETALFHLLRYSETSRRHLLLTSRMASQELPFTLPDVRSRLLAMPVATIDQPDDALLRAFFAKAFSDRQWRISGNVIHYIASRSERSFAAAQKLIEGMEHLLLATNREITIPMIKPLVE